MSSSYPEFLAAKVAAAPALGIEISEDEVNPACKPHVRRIVPWMVRGGRRALFASFGLQKTVTQLEAVRLVLAHVGGRGLIVCPLGVRQEFKRDAVERLGWAEPPRFIRSIEEAEETGIHLTNYETVREGKLDPKHFNVVSLDEAAVLRGFGGTQTFRELMRLFAGDAGRGPSGGGPRLEAGCGVRYRFVATATPSPNEYIELLAYAAYLGIMDVSAAKTRFFKRDSTKADQLTIHPHKEAEFWLWVASWALFITRPSDIDPSFSDEGYELPPLDVRWHEVATDHSGAGAERDGQARLYRNAALGVQDAAREKRDSLGARIAKLQELRAEDPAAHRILWHDLEAERAAIEDAVPGIVTVYGSQDLDSRERAIIDFSDGKIPEIGAKPVMLGAGTNLQRHCAWAIFLGIGFKFNDFIQACHRVHRFGQTRQVRLDLIYTEAEREIRRALETKWAQHTEMVARMTALIREHGLAHASLASSMARSLTVERAEISGDGYRLINGDAVEEIRSIESDSVHLVVTSIPFSTQYEYTPSYRDLGHTDNDEHFFQHLGFITPELLRVLKPGRVAAVHVKDRIVPGGLTGLGFQTVSPFSDYTIAHFRKYGFAFLARKTVVTDVVRENNQTYRLGWTEQCKDGSRMGAGLPEYVLLFRKPPTDSSDGYADEPVVKSKGKYSRTRWQIDAHGFQRSNGNRHLRPEEIADLPHAAIFKLFRAHSLGQPYDFEEHVCLGEALEEKGRLPVTFMLLQPASWHPDVWTDVARMRTLNGAQAAKGREMHLCPLQFDIVDRLIAQFTQEGELVFDPFGGLMTVPYCAIRMKRRGLAIELNPRYVADGALYCAAAARDMATPTLFDLDAIPEATGVSAAIAPAAVRERPILFSGPMVRAILEGRKTQTRRVMKRQPPNEHLGFMMLGPALATLCGADYPDGDSDEIRCPYGQPGDRLWVRESHRFAESGSDTSDSVHYRADLDEVAGGPWRPSIHMHRWASRITLELTGVSVQRLQQITHPDARAEGSCVRHAGKPCPPMTYDGLPSTPPWPRGPRICFGSGWNLLNAERGYPWSSNPWVWVLAFRRLA